MLKLGLLLGLFTLAFAAGGCGRPPSELEIDRVSAKEVYARLEQAMTRPGQVFHTTVRISQDAGLLSYEGRFELWGDPDLDKAHKVLDMTSGGGSTLRWVEILVGGEIYRPSELGFPASKETALQCRDASPLVSAIIACWALDEEGETSVDVVQYEGVAAVVLATEVMWSGSDENFKATQRLYLDAETFLPIVLRVDGSVDYGEVSALLRGWTYKNDFLPLDSLPDDFFDPASIGYVEPDADAPTPTPMPRPTVDLAAEEAPPKGPGVVIGQPYPFRIGGHCGVRDTRFDGRWWLPDPVPTYGSNNPPTADDGAGTMTLVAEDRAVFAARSGRKVEFLPRPPDVEPRLCF